MFIIMENCGMPVLSKVIDIEKYQAEYLLDVIVR